MVVDTSRDSDFHHDVVMKTAMRAPAATLTVNQWHDVMENALDSYATLIDVIRRCRSVRRFAPGRAVDRSVLLKIAEAARWAPTGANSQCFDLIIIDDMAVREQTLEIFLAQSNRLIDHVKGFPAVKKTYLANTVAIFLVLADERWKIAFPNATTAAWAQEYRENNERILLASIGAVVQNIQLAVTAVGLTSAYRSVEDANLWEDADKRLGPWRDAFTGSAPNPSGMFD